MKIPKRLTFLTLLLSLGAMACDTGDPPDGDDDDDECEVPACVLEMYLLTVNCRGTGSCVAQQTATGVNECYSDGRKHVVNFGETNSSIQLFNADGSVCTTQEIAAGEGGRRTVTIKDGSGATLGALAMNDNVLESASCDGNTYLAAQFVCEGDDDDDDDDDDGVECTMGTCT